MDGKSFTEIRHIGTCRVNYNGRDMGYTQGGVTVKITTEWVDINVDSYGVVPIDAQDKGTTIEATTPLPQTSLENYNDAYDTSVLGNVARGMGAEDRLHFGRIVGTSINKHRLVLDPINESDGIVMYAAGAFDVDELGYTNEGVRILNIHWKAFISEDRADGDRLFRIFGGMS